MSAAQDPFYEHQGDVTDLRSVWRLVLKDGGGVYAYVGDRAVIIAVLSDEGWLDLLAQWKAVRNAC